MSCGNLSPPLCKMINENETLYMDNLQKIRTFTKDDALNNSTLIIDVLTGKTPERSILFSVNGSIGILNKTTRKIDQSFLNAITSEQAIDRNSDVIEMTDPTKNEYFISSNGYWILYVDIVASQVIILYNIFHREDFKQYFLKDRPARMKTFFKYCDEINNKDGSCYCIPSNTGLDGERCVKKLYNDESIRAMVKKDSLTAYNESANMCPCFLEECRQSYPKLPDSSFIKNPVLRRDNDAGLYGLDECKKTNMTFTICNQTVTAGKDMAGNSALSQNCGVTKETSAPDTPAPATTTKPNASAPTTTTKPNASAPTTTTKPNASAPATTTKPGSSTQATSADESVDGLPLWAIILIAVVALLILCMSSFLLIKSR